MNAPLDLNADLIEPATLAAIDAAQAAEEAARVPRGHLGMSQIGKPDERYLWLKFRWSLPDTPAPRTMRIFQLGHYIEIELARLLRATPGIELHTENENGSQFSFSYLGGHFGGSMDGAIHGLPEAPKTWHVWEAKSVSSKRFADLVKKGVKAWSPEYYAQLQCYMGATGMERAFFTAMNKDNSEIHAERVKREPMFWEAMQAKAERIIIRDDMPPSSWPGRDWFEAKYMPADAQAVYWGDRLPRQNCRNCRHITPRTDLTGAVWSCARHGFRSTSEQHAGCADHNYLPAFIPLELIGSDIECATYKSPGGVVVHNVPGKPEYRMARAFCSAEFEEIHKAGYTLADDAFLNEMRDELGAKVVNAEAFA